LLEVDVLSARRILKFKKIARFKFWNLKFTLRDPLYVYLRLNARRVFAARIFAHCILHAAVGRGEIKFYPQAG